MAQEGKKVKPILPTKPSRFTKRKTSRTNRTSLKSAEDFFFFPPFPVNSCFISVLLSFFYSFLLPSFTFFIPYSCLILCIVLISIKIPSYLASDLSVFLLPSSLSFSIPCFPPSLLLSFFFSPFLFFPQVRQENLEC